MGSAQSLDAYSMETRAAPESRRADAELVEGYLSGSSVSPLLLCGDALEILRSVPDESIDCCMTSPPYWKKRQYACEGIGQESTAAEYVRNLLEITGEIKRALKPAGSFWLNVGDTYQDKSLQSIPWRIAIEMTDSQGWILRNTVVWNKVKGNPDNSADKLRNMYEPVFHFVKCKKYYYDVDSARNPPSKAEVRDGRAVSSTGVSGVRYRKQIEGSSVLSAEQKESAVRELDRALEDMREGRLFDFRMIIKGQQRATHSDSESVSGRAKELNRNGFYILRNNPSGSKPGDVWNIVPEDTQNRGGHYAAYPEELCLNPIKMTCPKEGVVLDPFCGTGTTMKAAMGLGRKSIGIDVSSEYIRLSEGRVDGKQSV
ncbi:MAG: site-specific DNA-methyltransferase [Candidatus Methanoplasma sp.]|jgi:site-specific DNA-methyltransferase (adenine-specific)|nr:site-specific DNA-methyltransferase [Candidatus Methanoplasma sp.]